MSSSEPRKGNTSQPDTAVGEPAAKPRSNRRRIVLPFTVDPDDLERGSLSWLERIKKDLKSASLALLASIVIHASILLALGFVVFQTRQILDRDTIIATWDSSDAVERTKSKSKRRELTVPIDLAAIDSSAASAVADSASPAVSADSNAAGTAGAVGVRPVDVTSALAGRNPRTRITNLEQLGGSPHAEQAIKAGLGWLARQQTSDGHWELHQGYPDAGRSYVKTDTGATALALLAFLGHGQTHQLGEHKSVVAKGLNWLQSIQDRTTGDLHDQRQEEGRNAAFYAHSMATIALCEDLALTHDEQLRPSAELAVKYLVNSQHPDLGGWKYRPLTQRVMSGDLSVTAWALMALHSARIAGIPVSPDEFERSSRFLDRVQEMGGSRYKYEPDEPASRVSVARTAIGLLCRQWLGWPRDYPPMTEGIRFLMEPKNRPEWSAGRRNVFEWYYVTQVIHNIGGEEWKQWNTAVCDAVIRNQISGGTAKPGHDTRGSWNPKPEGEGEEYADKAGRLYLTAMCILILETPYRHRPLYAD